MRRARWRDVLRGLSAVVVGLLASSAARGQTPASEGPPPGAAPAWPVCSADQIVRMCPAELDALYAQGIAAPVPTTQVRGVPLVAPGKRWAVSSSKAARLVWQGKVFDPSGASVVNRFFGVRAIRGNVYMAESWRDGGPALIIDYSTTSLLYAHYRDEIRQVGPGLYLGLMYTRDCPPALKTYFALEACP